MTTQLVALRDNLLTRAPDLGFGITTTATNGAATATTASPRAMRLGTASPSGQYAGWYLTIPSANAANKSRTVVSTTVSTTVMTFTTNTAYSEAGLSSVAGYLTRLPLATIDLILTDTLKYQWYNQVLALTEVTDGDMSASTTTNWTDSIAPNAATSSKVTTAANVPFGLTRAMRVLNSQVNGYTRSGLTRTTRGKNVYVWTLCRADVGTAVLTLTNASGTSIDTLSTTEEDWVFMYEVMDPATTDEELYFRLGGSGASDDTYWGACGFIRPGAQNIVLPSSISRHVNLRGLYYADWHVSGTESGVYPAHSRNLHRLVEGPQADYIFHSEVKGATANRIELFGDWSSYPLFVDVQRPYSDVETLSAETDTTSADPILHTAIAVDLLAERYPKEFGHLATGARADAEALQRQEETQLPPERVRPFRGWSRR